MKTSRFACVILLLVVTVHTVNADFFINSGAMNSPRSDHTATVLTNGQVLVAAGNYLPSAELYDVASGNWTYTGFMQTAREAHTATLLTNGKVLVTGGYVNTGGNGVTPSCELYNSASKTWTATGSLLYYHAQHTATLLLNGKVLVAGGWGGGGPSPIAEIYDTSSGNWTMTGSMTNARVGHTATLLSNGKVLVAGGQNQTTPFSSAEIYDPATGAWTTTGTMNKSRSFHTATLLPNGLVLVAGGTSDGTVSAELYNSGTGTWTVAAPMVYPRFSHIAMPLTNGFVLVAGGVTNGYGTSTAELYDPINNVWRPTGSLSIARAEFAAVLLPNGHALMIGGENNSSSATSSTEIYDSTNDALPFIANQPQSIAVTNGHSASFTVAATGILPLTYQWSFNGANLLNSTNTTVTLQNVFPVNAGTYTVTVASTYGSVTSNPAMLTVLPLGITSPKLLANHQFQFSFDTATGVNYAVQYSTNLIQWFSFVTLGGIGVPLTLIDPNAASTPQRFYRISLSPQ